MAATKQPTKTSRIELRVLANREQFVLDQPAALLLKAIRHLQGASQWIC